MIETKNNDDGSCVPNVSVRDDDDVGDSFAATQDYGLPRDDNDECWFVDDTTIASGGNQLRQERQSQPRQKKCDHRRHQLEGEGEGISPFGLFIIPYLIERTIATFTTTTATTMPPVHGDVNFPCHLSCYKEGKHRLEKEGEKETRPKRAIHFDKRFDAGFFILKAQRIFFQIYVYCAKCNQTIN